jgi:hypothetical protein
MGARDAIPVESPYRRAIELFASPDPAAQRKAADALRPIVNALPAQLEEPLVLAVLDAVFEGSFPPPQREWDRGPEELVFSLIGNVTPAVLAHIEAGYGGANPRFWLDLLTIALAAGTREAAETVVRLVERYGWPRRFYPRFFAELSQHGTHADILYPKLLEVPGGPEVDLLEGLLRALRAGTHDPARLEGSAFVRSLPARLAHLRAVSGGNDDAPANARGVYAALLELAGHVGGQELLPELRAALSHPHPWPVVFAVVSLVRRGEDVPADVLARVGAVHEVRIPLYTSLAQLGRQALLPASARTREAFAAADVTRWLMHTSELGQPPAALELMDRFTVDHDGRPAELFVWRFRDEDESAWLAATSGPYAVDAPEGPLSGTLTFSKFERWETRDARGHADSIRTTLSAWAARS